MKKKLEDIDLESVAKAIDAAIDVEGNDLMIHVLIGQIEDDGKLSVADLTNTSREEVHEMMECVLLGRGGDDSVQTIGEYGFRIKD